MINSFSGGDTGTPMFQPPNGDGWWKVLLVVIVFVALLWLVHHG